MRTPLCSPPHHCVYAPSASRGTDTPCSSCCKWNNKQESVTMAHNGTCGGLGYSSSLPSTGRASPSSTPSSLTVHIPLFSPIWAGTDFALPSQFPPQPCACCHPSGSMSPVPPRALQLPLTCLLPDAGSFLSWPNCIFSWMLPSFDFMQPILCVCEDGVGGGTGEKLQQHQKPHTHSSHSSTAWCPQPCSHQQVGLHKSKSQTLPQRNVSRKMCC